MTRLLVLSLTAIATLTPAVAANSADTARQRPLGVETVIINAGNGGIRNFEAGPPGSSLVYLQDRTLRWYKVTLTGPCLPDRTLDTVQFRTDNNGNFDRFSQIVSLRYPNRVCGVTSIVTSAPPPGQPGGDTR